MKRTAMHAMLQQAPTVDFRGLVRMMVAADLAAAGTTLPDPRPRG
jgi:hypothetical protein